MDNKCFTPVDYYRVIGNNVKKQRELKGLSQLDLASELGHSSPAFVTKAENTTLGKHFNLEHIIEIAKILEIDICLLFEGIQSKN